MSELPWKIEAQLFHDGHWEGRLYYPRTGKRGQTEYTHWRIPPFFSKFGSIPGTPGPKVTASSLDDLLAEMRRHIPASREYVVEEV